ncbi:MAG: hypothetical protein M3Y04_04720 [Actinomycetota bacterium]|nr:hypothetical protein [Actinomycetota bacterium]
MAENSPGWVDGHVAVPVSAEDVKRVVGRALAGGTRRIRLTYGQRLAIVNAPHPGGGTGA